MQGAAEVPGSVQPREGQAVQLLTGKHPLNRTEQSPTAHTGAVGNSNEEGAAERKHYMLTAACIPFILYHLGERGRKEDGF